jgi:hypothetical protein
MHKNYAWFPEFFLPLIIFLNFENMKQRTDTRIIFRRDQGLWYLLFQRLLKAIKGLIRLLINMHSPVMLMLLLKTYPVIFTLGVKTPYLTDGYGFGDKNRMNFTFLMVLIRIGVLDGKSGLGGIKNHNLDLTVIVRAVFARSNLLFWQGTTITRQKNLA